MRSDCKHGLTLQTSCRVKGCVNGCAKAWKANYSRAHQMRFWTYHTHTPGKDGFLARIEPFKHPPRSNSTQSRFHWDYLHLSSRLWHIVVEDWKSLCKLLSDRNRCCDDHMTRFSWNLCMILLSLVKILKGHLECRYSRERYRPSSRYQSPERRRSRR